MSDLRELFAAEERQDRDSTADAATTGVRALGALFAAMVREDDRKQRDLLRMVADEIGERVEGALGRLRAPA